jgi:hypothetical protein
LGLLCGALAPKLHTKRQLQRKLDRQRRANNPQHYDKQGRCKKGRKTWHDSKGYQTTRRRLASAERTLAAHRKSLHGQLAHDIVAMGDTILTEKISYRAWQRLYGFRRSAPAGVAVIVPTPFAWCSARWEGLLAAPSLVLLCAPLT